VVIVKGYWEIPVVIVMCPPLLSIVVVILISASSASLPATEAQQSASTPAERRLSGVEVTEQVRASSGTRPACRLMARDPYLSSRVRQMSDDGNVHLIKYSLQFPDGFSGNITGPRLTAY